MTLVVGILIVLLFAAQIAALVYARKLGAEADESDDVYLDAADRATRTITVCATLTASCLILIAALGLTTAGVDQTFAWLLLGGCIATSAVSGFWIYRLLES